MDFVPKQLRTPRKCILCNNKFRDYAEYANHLIREFDLDISSTYSICESIDMAIPITDFGEPTAAFKDKYSCKFCKKLCKGVKGLSQHISKVHISKDQQEVCKTCGKSFRNKYALKFHMTQVHTDSNKVLCEICGKKIYNKYMLEAHIKKKHKSSFSIS